VKLLWGTANLFSNPRYMCGAATNPDAHVFAYAAAQVKKALEVTHELGGDGYYVLGRPRGLRDPAQHDLKREQEHLARFLHMAVDYAKAIGFKGQFYIEPKPKEPTKHQYDFDVASGIAFLRTYGLEALQVQHRDQPRDPGRPQLPARDRGRGVPGPAGLGRRQRRRPAARLGHGPVQHRREGDHARHGLDPARRGPRQGRVQLRRQAAPPLHRPGGPLLRAHRGHGHLRPRLQDRAPDPEPTARSTFLAERYSSYDSGFGRAIETGKTSASASWRSWSAGSSANPFLGAGGRSISRTCSTGT
jgi:hypothetical protein